MDMKILFILFIALLLIISTWLGYYTNWFIHNVVIYYGWYPVILFDIGILLFFIILVITLK